MEMHHETCLSLYLAAMWSPFPSPRARSTPSSARSSATTPPSTSSSPRTPRWRRSPAASSGPKGTVWVKNGGYLLFSDIPNNVVHKWKEGEGVTEFLKPAGYTGKKPRGGKPGDEPGSNGLRIDAEGRLTLCEHGDRRVARIDVKLGPDTKPMIGYIEKTTLADKYGGKRLNSPNDLVFHSNGDLYFTDPPYGLPKHFDDPARELDFCGVYRVEAGRHDHAAHQGNEPAQRHRPVAGREDALRRQLRARTPGLDELPGQGRRHDRRGQGLRRCERSSSRRRSRALPDGLKVDVKGNLFATGPGGVLIISPKASCSACSRPANRRRTARSGTTARCTSREPRYLPDSDDDEGEVSLRGTYALLRAYPSLPATGWSRKSRTSETWTSCGLSRPMVRRGYVVELFQSEARVRRVRR